MEVVGAVQFAPLQPLRLQDLIRFGHELDSYDLEELQPELSPIVEVAPGQPPPAPFAQLFVGQANMLGRALYHAADPRFLAQVQRDRVAINERRLSVDDEAPSSTHLWPRLEVLLGIVERHASVSFGAAQARIVELTYVNVIRPEAELWTSYADVHKVFTLLARPPGPAPFDKPEAVNFGASFAIHEDGVFRGRLHLLTQPAVESDGSPIIQFQVVSRRLVDPGSGPLAEEFEACHRTAVLGFVASTSAEMHTIWGRTR